MNEFGETEFTGAVGLAQPAGAATAPVRLQEFSAALANYAVAGHGHTLSDLSDLAALGSYVAAVLADTASASWTLNSGTGSVAVRVQPGGGVVVGAAGLAVDLTGVAAPAAHTHLVADVTDFTSELLAHLAAKLEDTATLAWGWDWSEARGDQLLGTVRLQSNGGLVAGAMGLALDVGLGATQVAAGDHTHAQLHASLTLAASATLDLSLATQQLSAEARLDGAGGLTVLEGGLGVLFGSGTGQVASGGHSHAQLHPLLTTVATASVVLAVDAEQVLSGTVRLDAAPGAGRGRVLAGAGGLVVELGTSAATAAAGNHSHTVASSAADGFLSAADKGRLDALALAVLSGSPVSDGLRVDFDGYGVNLGAGALEYLVVPYAATLTGWDVLGAPAGGAAVVDVWRAANFPPTVGDRIAGTERVTLLSGSQLARNATITSWTRPLAAGDVLGFRLDSATAVKRLAITLRVSR